MDVAFLIRLVVAMAAWLDRQQREGAAYLLEENRILRRQIPGRVRLTDAERRRLAVLGHRLGRQRLSALATLVTPDTILRWHRHLVARKWTFAHRVGRRQVLDEIRRLVVRMARENPLWGYTRMQGALANVGHRVGRSTIARILKAHGLPPVPDRPTSWRVFLRAHWGAIAGADLFTTEVWTWRGLVTVYTAFAIDLATRRVRILGTTRHPNAVFMQGVAQQLGARSTVLICDRDAKWSRTVRDQLARAGVRVVQTPLRAPNANAHAERFVRSIKEECLHRIVPFGERHLRVAIDDYVAHYHHERNHQGLENRLLDAPLAVRAGQPVRRRSRLGGLLNFYFQSA